MHPLSKPGPSNIRGKVNERFITFKKQVVPAATEEELPERATAVADKHEMYHVKHAKKDYEEVNESTCLRRRKKMRLVVTIELGAEWMPNSNSASNFMLLGPTKLFLWPFKITRFFKNYMDFSYEKRSGGNFFPKFIFIWRSHIKISENGNFQTAVKIVWQAILTQNFAFRHKF